MYPMMSPDQSPHIMHPYAFQGSVVTLVEVESVIVNVDGRIYIIGIMAMLIKTVEIISCH